MSGICMTKCIREVVIPKNPPFFSLYVDDGYARRKKGPRDELGDALNAFHPKLNFTVENEPDRFLDCAFVKNTETRTFTTKVFHKPNKLPIHWSSQTPRRYKRNAITCELHRAFVISDHFDEEVEGIRERYKNAGFPIGFINDVIDSFKFSRFEQIIPPNLFEQPDDKPTIRVRLPYCAKNENLTRTFLKKLRSFIGESFNVYIIWNTSKIRSLFPLKDKNLHPHCIIYKGTCSCGEIYIGETERCNHLRFDEHENIKKTSEPSKHLKDNRNHSFTWEILSNAPSHLGKRKILEALFVAKFKPGLNEQVKSKKLVLFSNGIT